jgi:hypothetical protein
MPWAIFTGAMICCARCWKRIVEDFEGRRDGRRLQIVFLGDYIDRGDQSRDVLER